MASRSTRRATGAGLRERITAARTHYDASWAGEVGHELKALDFVNWITMFGAALLWSARR